ncbi:magnesium-dependent phosphatase [Pseudoscourfieldia marina]
MPMMLVNKTQGLCAPRRRLAPARAASSSSSPTSSPSGINSSKNKTPKLVVFDLDGLIWEPELYMMDMPLRRREDGNVMDRFGDTLRLYDGAKRALAELHFSSRFRETQIAYASRTHQKKDALRAFEWFELSARDSVEDLHDDYTEASSVTMADVARYVEIRSGSKQQHFRNLHKASGIAYEDMLFLDNERWNISEVSALGVCSVYCPRGLVDEGVSLGDHSEWERALVEYEAVAIKKRTRQRRR